MLPTEALVVRAAETPDADAVAELACAICGAEGDTSVATTPAELLNDWQTDGFELGRDAFLAETGAGQLLGYAALFDDGDHCALSVDTYVFPHARWADAGALLLEAMDRRAQEHLQLAPAGQPTHVRTVTNNRDKAGKAALARAGYAPVRYHWRMGIELDAAPPAPALPPGLEFRPFVQTEHAAAIWQARNEAFEGNWGSHPQTFEEFTHHVFDDPEYNPELWSVVWDGQDLAGFSINRYRMGIGWIRTLGVRSAWRTRGLARRGRCCSAPSGLFTHAGCRPSAWAWTPPAARPPARRGTSSAGGHAGGERVRHRGKAIALKARLLVCVNGIRKSLNQCQKVLLGRTNPVGLPLTNRARRSQVGGRTGQAAGGHDLAGRVKRQARPAHTRDESQPTATSRK